MDLCLTALEGFTTISFKCVTVTMRTDLRFQLMSNLVEDSKLSTGVHLSSSDARHVTFLLSLTLVRRCFITLSNFLLMPFGLGYKGLKVMCLKSQSLANAAYL